MQPIPTWPPEDFEQRSPRVVKLSDLRPLALSNPILHKMFGAIDRGVVPEQAIILALGYLVKDSSRLRQMANMMADLGGLSTVVSKPKDEK